MPLTVTMVVLDYECSVCGGPIAATLRCEGEMEGPEGPLCASAGLACPHCQRVSDVVFDADGSVHFNTARPNRTNREPIWN